ncbi:hypothetical protein MTO96_052279 [Rhipicephalus appendiculatus]
MSFSGLQPPPPFLSSPGHPDIPWGAMDPGFQEHTDRFGRIRPTCHSSEGDPAELLGHGRTADLPDSDDNGRPVPCGCERCGRDTDVSLALMSSTAPSRRWTVTSRSTVNVTAARHRFRRRTQAPGETAAEYVTALKSRRSM